MSYEKIGIHLSMVPFAEEAIPASRAAAPPKPAPGFDWARMIQQTALLALIVLLSIGAYLAISRYFVETVQVVGISMTPTLEENNHYLLNRWAFHKRDPERRDIVVIKDPGDKGLSVKRVIAVAGESVYFKDGMVFVNGKQLKEPYLAPNTLTYTYSQSKEQLIMCGKEQYFVLGDNRVRSIDSRSYGAVSRDDILGLVIVR